MRKREQLLLSSGFLVVVSVMCLFLTAPWVGLQCTIVTFTDHLTFEETVDFHFNISSFLAALNRKPEIVSTDPQD